MEIWTIQNASILATVERDGFYRPAPPLCMDNTECSPVYFRLPYRFMTDCLYEKCGLPLGWTKSAYLAALRQDDTALSFGWTLTESPGGFPVLSCIPSDMPHPVWGWAKRAGRRDGKPDMRSWRTTEPEDVVRLRLEIPEERLLFSDFDAWHIPLNLGYMLPRDADERQVAQLEAELEKQCRNIGLNGIGDLFSEKTGIASMNTEKARKLQKQVMGSWRECLIENIGRAAGDDGDARNTWRGYFPDIEPNDLEIQCVFWEICAEDIVSVEYFQTRRSGRVQ